MLEIFYYKVCSSNRYNMYYFLHGLNFFNNILCLYTCYWSKTFYYYYFMYSPAIISVQLIRRLRRRRSWPNCVCLGNIILFYIRPLRVIIYSKLVRLDIHVYMRVRGPVIFPERFIFSFVSVRVR